MGRTVAKLLHSSGKYSQKELAKRFGINSRTVSSLVNFKHFKHISAEEN